MSRTSELYKCNNTDSQLLLLFNKTDSMALQQTNNLRSCDDLLLEDRNVSLSFEQTSLLNGDQLLLFLPEEDNEETLNEMIVDKDVIIENNHLLLTNSPQEQLECVSESEIENLLITRPVQEEQEEEEIRTTYYINLNGLSIMPQHINVEDLNNIPIVESNEENGFVKIFNLDSEMNLNGILTTDEEPDSTVANDTLNINELATIVTTYRCKYCTFSCQNRKLFLSHYKQKHFTQQENCLDDRLEESDGQTEVVNENENENENENQIIYLCSQCAKEFTTKEDCRQHMINIHNLSPTDKEIAMENEGSLEENRKQENAEYDKNKKILENIVIQDVLKPRKHKCTITGCNYKFAKAELLAQHLSCHVNELRRQFRCISCEKEERYDSWRSCSNHLWKIHGIDIDLYNCPLCDFKSPTYCTESKIINKIQSVQAHLNWVGSKEIPNWNFNTTNPVQMTLNYFYAHVLIISVLLHGHLNVHNMKREYKCKDCNRVFTQLIQFRNHLLLNHLDESTQELSRSCLQKLCNICRKFFADSKCLKKHIQTVHSKLKPFICNVCGHSCARKSMLQSHLRQHTGEKPYACNICFYKTADHNSLRRHVMRHSGKRPYKCPYCSYRSIQSNPYKNHLARKHPGMAGVFKCSKCSFKTIKEDNYGSHILLNCKGNDSSKLDSTIHASSSETETSSSTDRRKEKPSRKITEMKKNFEIIDDEETQNCFLLLNESSDEQTVDKGGITIPADPNESVTLITQ